MNKLKKFLLFLFIFIGEVSFSQIDSLKNVVESNQPDSIRIKAIFAWDDLIYLDNPDLDLKLNERVCAICLKGLKKYNNKKTVLFYKINLAKAQNNLGYVLFERGDYKKAIEYHSKSLKINDELNDDKGAALTLGNLANIYYQLDELDKALEYYNKNLKIVKKLKNKSLQSTTYNNMANIYADQKKQHLAISYYRKSFRMAFDVEDSIGMSRALNNIGTVFHDLRNYDSATFYYQNSLDLRIKTNDLKGMASSYGDLGLIYLKKKEYEKAILHLDKAEKYAREAQDIMDLKNISQTLYLYHKNFDNHTEALKYFELFSELKDSIASDENTRASIQREYKYSYEKQADEERIKREQQKKVDEAIIAKQKIQQYALFGGLFLVIAFLIFIFNRYKVVQKQKHIIELKEKETQFQKEEIEEKQREILDSITYAKRIQEAILPSDNVWFESFPESFILYLPKDIIAGDFYFLEKKKENIYFAVADCTGHGVPGAMVSVVCSTALTKCIQEYHIEETGKILDKTRELIVQQFEKSSDNVRDGMDISFGKIDFSNKSELKLQWSGANNPLIHIRSKQATEIESTKEPIGNYENPSPFKTNEISLQKGDMIYLFSDGYSDQFGGPQRKKFRKNNLYKLLIEISDLDGSLQKEKLLNTMNDWKGNTEQIDDVCIIGIKI